MSVLFVLIYIIKDAALRRCVSKHRIEDDEDFLEMFSRILVGLQISTLFTALEEGIRLEWTDVYDYINPFGDRRGRIFNSIWTFNLDKDILFLTKPDCVSAAPLYLARQRPLTLSDFQPTDEGIPDVGRPKALHSPYWSLEMDVSPLRRSFLGRLLTDFGYTWRHILRRPMNNTTLTKLAYATVWISAIQFDIFERQGFENVSGYGGPYVGVLDLPNWNTPEAQLFQIGSTWFIFSQQLQEGIEMARDHARSYQPTAASAACANMYAILTLRQITFCKMADGNMAWTRPENLFSDGSPSSAAIDMLIWASNPTTEKLESNRLHLLPLEIQNNILHYATPSLVSSARLGCILSLGSPFAWAERGQKIELQDRKRNRAAESPVESQIVFHDVMSGLSYRLEPLPVKMCTVGLLKVGLASTGEASCTA